MKKLGVALVALALLGGAAPVRAEDTALVVTAR